MNILTIQQVQRRFIMGHYELVNHRVTQPDVWVLPGSGPKGLLLIRTPELIARAHHLHLPWKITENRKTVREEK